MKKGKIVNSKVLVDHIINLIKTNIITRLADFCKRRVVEVGLTTPGLVGEFDLVSNAVTARKNVSRLKTLIYKYLVKRIPYIALTTTEFMQMAGRDTIAVCFKTPQMTSDFDYVDWRLIRNGGKLCNYDVYSSSTSLKESVARAHPSVKWVARYVRYINYLARKNSVPICITGNFDIVFDKVASEKAYYSEKRSKEILPFNIVCSLKIHFLRWVSSDEERHSRIRNGEIEDDSFFANADLWSTSNILGVSPERGSSRGKFTIEKVFLHLDKIVNSIGSLSRKAYYEASAYSFRSSSDS